MFKHLTHRRTPILPIVPITSPKRRNVTFALSPNFPKDSACLESPIYTRFFLLRIYFFWERHFGHISGKAWAISAQKELKKNYFLGSALMGGYRIWVLEQFGQNVLLIGKILGKYWARGGRRSFLPQLSNKCPHISYVLFMCSRYVAHTIGESVLETLVGLKQVQNKFIDSLHQQINDQLIIRRVCDA